MCLLHSLIYSAIFKGFVEGMKMSFREIYALECHEIVRFPVLNPVGPLKQNDGLCVSKIFDALNILTCAKGSPWATISLCGDVMGPAFEDDEPVTLERLFPTGHGRFGKGTEYHIFNLAANTWQLHYFRLTNQLQGRNISCQVV